MRLRTAAEFAGGHVRGAVNVPMTALRSRLESLKLDPARPVVAVCLTAHRSVPAVRLLRERGFGGPPLRRDDRVARGEAAGGEGLSRP
jgi:rhodanese-related sulfurtransferase